MEKHHAALNFILKGLEAEYHNDYPTCDEEMFLSRLGVQVAANFNLSHRRIRILYKRLQEEGYLNNKYEITSAGINFIDKGGYRVVKVNFKIDNVLKYITGITLIYSAVFTYLNYINSKEVNVLKSENKELKDSLVALSNKITKYKTQSTQNTHTNK